MAAQRGVHRDPFCPGDQFIHYPLPPAPIKNFRAHVRRFVHSAPFKALTSKQVITVTNYTGESRSYLKRLINDMGARYTKTMSSRNTIVIAAL